MINEMIQQNENDNGSKFKTPFPTSQEAILKKMAQHTPGTPIKVLPYPTQ